ncbi:hypothetical protein HMPREF1991_01653 [Hoylesella loescheii DSM 19665 = JCM 12249 = ATCC 15930]|uniref:Uncharacterized protein n=1 Tax=Hoylesella loescheii DSM 19665 = JCM 12249 = ATCC 15930 TaxID=1122985 RepID=A0A069QH96_HOYLO|nr:hypothetical protein HMPREF1991_01653 [Hoylesella loescheii DSM 19665 = JCM 12249 = ATCC 15930]
MVTHLIREFGIRPTHYANCHVAQVAEIAIPLPVHSCSEGMVSYPNLTNSPFHLLHFHSSENALSKP